MSPETRALLEATWAYEEGWKGADYHALAVAREDAQEAWHKAGGPDRSPERPELPAEPSPGFVRVRIPVEVWALQTWLAHEWGPDLGADDLDIQGDGSRLSWVLADVPLPVPAAEVLGAVEVGGSP